MNNALSGLRVLDLTHMLSGPYCTMILGDMGAEMIKVEPIAGEGTRKLLATDPEHSIDGMGAYFITLNRNKKSIAIDLKSEDGLALFYSLVEQADIVVNNYAAGVPEKLKIDYPRLAEINPRIISCSITGFGEQGPGAKRPAFDQVAQAYGGGMSITGEDTSQPMRAGIPIGDLGGGMFGVMGILSAVIERYQSGRGQHVDISMLDAQISLLNYMATMHFMSGNNPQPIGNSHFVHVPYNSYPTADGHLVICVITDNFWHNLKGLLHCEALEKSEYDTQPGRLADKTFIDTTLADIFHSQSTAYWMEKLNAQRIPAAPVNTFSQALNDEQVLYRNMVVDLAHPNGQTTKGPGCPIKLSRSEESAYTPAPLLGQDTQHILSDMLAMPDDEIDRLRSKGVIA